MRRLRGESVAVITGHKAFRYLDFYVNGDVLAPRPETETLVDAALRAAPVDKSAAAVLDLCTGSGAAGLSVKYEAPELSVTLSDICPLALAVARKNRDALQLDAAIVESDLFAAFDDGVGGEVPAVFDVIMSNPPYIAAGEIKTLSKEVQHEPHLALDGGADGLALIRRIIRDAPRFLREGGALLLEIDPRQSAAVRLLLSAAGYTGIETFRDLSGHERVIQGRC
jgi:release factor glutamine methyltransferase